MRCKLRFFLLVFGALLLIGCDQSIDSPQEIYQSKKGSYPIKTKHLDAQSQPIYINSLIREESLYLLQHAHNPVNWQAWSNDIFEQAKQRDKPIFLSIGYSTCHWCHVMERESFENVEIANFINTNFIPVKVDREQHPAVDELYITAVQMLSGKAGWPLTAVLTPDGDAFFGGTYFQPQKLLSLLDRVNTTWSNRRDAVMEQANRIRDELMRLNQQTGSVKQLDDSFLTNAKSAISQDFKAVAVNQAAFPREPEMLFLLQQSLLKGESLQGTDIHERLLDMAGGGIHDQIGGGFHRYSVDAYWQVPHFEKMLYNQAQLGEVYAFAYLLTGDVALRSIAEQTFNFMLSDMQSPQGGFYTAMDAESDGQEGGYYIWQYQELAQALNEQELAIAKQLFGLKQFGNFHGNNILTRDFRQIPEPEVAIESNGLREQVIDKMRDIRQKRNAPMMDKKIITAWNAMAVSSLLSAYQALGHSIYREAALKALQRLWQEGYIDGKLLRTIDQQKVTDAALEDYAYLARALVDAYDISGDERWLKRAKQITKNMMTLFFDDASGAFSVGGQDSRPVGWQTALVTARDDEMLSGNSVTSQLLIRLYRRTGDAAYLKTVKQVLSAFADQMQAKPTALSGMLATASILRSGENGQHHFAGKSKVKINAQHTNGQLTVSLDIEPGWHINASEVLQDHLIPSALQPVGAECSSIGEVNYPQAKRVSLSFQNDELVVYEGKVNIKANLNKVNKEKCAVIAANLRLQACSDEVCLAPEVIRLRTGLQ